MPDQDATYTFEDLSGSAPTPAGANPYTALIDACDDDAGTIQERYIRHRVTHVAKQKDILLSPDFRGVKIDRILRQLLDDEQRPGNTRSGVADTRYNLSFWTRPTQQVRALIGRIQTRLRVIIPDLWLMPLERLHMSTLEICHSRSAEEVASLVAAVESVKADAINLPYTNYTTMKRRVRLIKPMLTYDAAAVAITWLPAAGEEGSGYREADVYTYHHLRRDLWEVASQTSNRNADKQPRGVPIVSRYVVPSAHITIARHVSAKRVTVDGSEEGAVDPARIAMFVGCLEEINEWLVEKHWPTADATDRIWASSGGEWIMGEERGIDLQGDTCWYGGGTTFATGNGFPA